MLRVLIGLTLFFVISCQTTGRDVQVIQSDQVGNNLLANKGHIRIDVNVIPAPGVKDFIAVNSTLKYQKIIGFGAAFTDSAAYTFSKSSAANQREIISAYWGERSTTNSSNFYTVMRLPIASCDYSLNYHSYDDVPNDFNFTHFSIAYDESYIIPFVKRAFAASGNSIKIVASPWSPPGWMKTNGKMIDGGSLLPSHYQHMANYMSKFVTAYKAAGIPIWGVTPQNEPESGNPGYPGCVYNAEQEAAFIKNNLGPTLKADHPEVNILGYDHNRDDIQLWAKVFYGDPDVAKYLWGMAFHWYAHEPDFQNVEATHDLNPGKGLMLTEAAACNTASTSWQRGEKFGYDIINDLNVWAEGFIQWNVILQEINGRWGPFESVTGVNVCEPPIVILNGTVVKKPSYYYIGHFSRFLPPGSVRIGASYNFTTENLYATSFLTPSDDVVLIIQNSNSWAVDLKVQDGVNIMAPKVPANGIQTLIYKSLLFKTDLVE